MSTQETPLYVTKNSGHIEEFDLAKITAAAARALAEVGGDTLIARRIADAVRSQLSGLPTNTHVSQLHDLVERALVAEHFDAGRAYISHRDMKRAKMGRPITPEVRRAFDAASKYFPTALQQFQFFDKYSRFSQELGRRETWPETVDRAVDFLAELANGALSNDDVRRLRNGILEMRVMPSMRLMAMAGEAARRNNVSLFNCSYNVIDSPYAFVEALIVSMSGCGVGYSVEKKFVEQMPVVGAE